MSFTNSGPSTTSTNNSSGGYGNIAFDVLVQTLPLTPSAVAANTSAEQTFTVTGVTLGDVVGCLNKPTAQAGLGIVGFRVSAANTIAITFANFTASPITPVAGEVYSFEICRPMPQYVFNLPTSLPL